MSEHADCFRSADLSAYPSFGSLDEDLERVLWVLWVAKDCGEDALQPAEISSILRDEFGIHISRQRAHGILRANHGQTVVRRRRDGKDVFQVLQAGIDAVSAPANAITLVDPASAFSGIRTAEEILRGLSGEVRICDPYVDPRTLDFLAELTGASEIRLLTVNVQRERPFRRDVSALGRQLGIGVEVRRAQSGLLHDRYVLDQATMIYFGTSIKDLGRKQTFVIQLGSGLVPAIRGTFDQIWSGSRVL